MYLSSIIVKEVAKWDEPAIVRGKLNKSGKVAAAAMMGDTLILVTSLVLFILKATHFNVPTAALFCFGALDTLVLGSWILMLACFKPSLHIKLSINILKVAFGDTSQGHNSPINPY